MLDINNDVIYKDLVIQLNKNLLASLEQEAEHQEFDLFDAYYAALNDMAADLLQAKEKGIDLKVDYGEGALIDLYFKSLFSASEKEFYKNDLLNIHEKDLINYQTLEREYIEYLAEEIRKYTNINGQKTFPSSVSLLKGLQFFEQEVALKTDLHFYNIRLFSLELHFLAEKSFYSTAKRTKISANAEDNIKNNDLIKKWDLKPATQISVDAQGNIQYNDLREKVDLKSSTSSSVFIEEIIASRTNESSKTTQVIKQKEAQARCSPCSVL
ncbi:hypothetical protein NOVO_01385 [Rickettsiales bacterium Ac37b]|nr:hypothetical protein NOVO_01385 [Rickettsiales bacterium Ac37b]